MLGSDGQRWVLGNYSGDILRYGRRGSSRNDARRLDRHCDADPDTYTNPHSGSDAHVQRCLHTYGHTHCCFNSHTHRHPNPNIHSHSDSHAHRYLDTYGHCYFDSHAHRYLDTNGYRYFNSHAHSGPGRAVTYDS